MLIVVAALAFATWRQKSDPTQKADAVTPTDIAALRSLQNRVQAAARSVSPAIVAIREAGIQDVDLPSDDQPHRFQPYATGVIITADGIVLSQFHASHLLEWNGNPGDPVRSRQPGERTTVILSDGRKVQAELLGADMTYDFSLLRLLEPGPYPFVPLEPKAEVLLGDWVLKLGHPIGYRPDRPAVVRLGRVLCLEGDLFVTDCNISGGDSGGPLIDLDGRLVGMVGDSEIPDPMSNVVFQDGTKRRPSMLKKTAIALPERLYNCDSSSIIQTFMPSMLGSGLSTTDRTVYAQRVKRLMDSENILPVDQWTQGTTTALAFQDIVEPATSWVVEIRGASDQPSALGTIVDPDGWILTVASLLPAEPKCRLPDQQVVSAEVVGVNREFDLALLKVSASDLHPVVWASLEPATLAGTILAAPSASSTTARTLLCVGIVSVPTRDWPGPFPERREHPKVTAQAPGLHGTPTAQGFRLDTIDAVAKDSGIQEGDVLLSINEKRIRTREDIANAADGHRPGERVVVRVLRDMKPVEFSLALSANRLIWSKRYASFPTYFEHDMPLLPHECGGPVIDLEGKALGISIYRAEYGCLAIPANCIQRLLPELRSGREDY